jgi:hypothetical protein
MKHPTILLTLVCVVTTFVACANKSDSAQQGRAAEIKTAKPATKISYPIDKCSFEKVVPGEGAAPLSEYGKALMYKLGTGILKQKDGSLCRLHCPNGESFAAWIDFDGKPVSALYGLSWMLASVDYSPGNSKKPRLWESRGGEWVELGGTIDDRTSPLPAGSLAPSATYSVFSGGSVSDYSARLLRYFGIGIGGRESKVKLTVGQYARTGTLSVLGTLRLENDAGWTEPIE